MAHTNGNQATSAADVTKGSWALKTGLARMLKGGVIMDVVTPDQAKLAEDAGADAQLKATYAQVLAKHSDDALFATRFKAAQQTWVSFRDAEIRAIYPSQDALNGTTLPMCSCAERTKLTQERVKQLQTWLKKNEGDVCAGSR